MWKNMKKHIVSFIIFSMSIIFLVNLSYCSKHTTQDMSMVNKSFKTQDIVSLFVLSVDDIQNNVVVYLDQAQQKINEIIAIPDNERTFSNTAKALDELVSLSDLAIAQRVYEALELLSPQDEIRNAAHDAFIKIQQFWVDQVSTNKKLYNAFMAYSSEQKENEQLSDQQRYFLNDTIESFKRDGLALPDDKLAQVKDLSNELSSLTADFGRNIAQDNKTIVVLRDELQGLEDDFIATLKQTEEGDYILGVDYPTYFRVMENCIVSDTRKKLYIAFNNRAYPVNDGLLKQIITKRDELAQLLGYHDFSYCDIDSQMAHTPERAYSFITDLIQRSLPKVMTEKALLLQEVPDSVVVGADGTIAPWDFAFVENNYKKKHFNIDEQKIAEYFPMKKTVSELLDIYRQFFSIDFKEVPTKGLWHEDVTVVQVLNKTGDELLGTLMLDLYPRPNKYSHAAHTTIIPSTFTESGIRIPDVSVVLANFSKPTDSQPSLLKRSEVQTFFHEFGHALHAVLGATTIASLSGTHTKTDFVELPSQMLEEWLWNKDILKKVSGHYQTGEPLSDEIIDTIISMKDLTSGYFVLRQAYLSLISLTYFGQGENKDPHVIMKNLYDSTMANVVSYSPDNHFYASFGHLTGYGAKYYGYLWSKVFALDIFAEIKKHGLLDPVIGQKYVKEILSKGGAQSPNELLYNFLGREPNSKAFFAEMGLK
jgi:thimet oligopeptidase